MADQHRRNASSDRPWALQELRRTSNQTAGVRMLGPASAPAGREGSCSATGVRKGKTAALSRALNQCALQARFLSIVVRIHPLRSLSGRASYDIHCCCELLKMADDRVRGRANYVDADYVTAPPPTRDGVLDQRARPRCRLRAPPQFQVELCGYAVRAVGFDGGLARAPTCTSLRAAGSVAAAEKSWVRCVEKTASSCSRQPSPRWASPSTM